MKPVYIVCSDLGWYHHFLDKCCHSHSLNRGLALKFTKPCTRAHHIIGLSSFRYYRYTGCTDEVSHELSIRSRGAIELGSIREVCLYINSITMNKSIHELNNRLTNTPISKHLALIQTMFVEGEIEDYKFLDVHPGSYNIVDIKIGGEYNRYSVWLNPTVTVTDKPVSKSTIKQLLGL